MTVVKARTKHPAPMIKNVALFMDFDGTLVGTASNPNDVVVPPATVSLLATLQEKTNGAMAIISGRRIDDLDRILSPLKFVASGCLGAEMRLDKNGSIYALAEPIPADVLEKLAALAASIPGVIFENKIYGACMHFREAPNARSRIEQELNAITIKLPRGMKIIFTQYSCEIKKHNLCKGSAVRNFFLTPTFKDKMPVYIGNDILDYEAFIAVRAMGGLSLYVGKKYVLPEVDFTLNSVQEVHKWLEDM